MFLLRYIINVCIFLPIILGLFLLATKLSHIQYSKINSRKYTQVLEKTMISKDTFSIVLRTGNNVYVGIMSPKGFDIIKELDKEEVMSIEYNLNKNITNMNYIQTNTDSLKEIKTLIQTTFLKLKSLLNNMLKEKF